MVWVWTCSWTNGFQVWGGWKISLWNKADIGRMFTLKGVGTSCAQGIVGWSGSNLFSNLFEQDLSDPYWRDGHLLLGKWECIAGTCSIKAIYKFLQTRTVGPHLRWNTMWKFYFTFKTPDLCVSNSDRPLAYKNNSSKDPKWPIHLWHMLTGGNGWPSFHPMRVR